MKILKGKIQELSNIFLSEIISYRRELHKYPELSMQEFKTSSFIKQKLRDFGISSLQDIATTGVIALVKGRNPDQKSIALRADMDALPIQENNDVEYKSQNHGVMHACGHDVHLASLLGTAKILFELRNDFDGTVKLFFQPSEEKYPGGAIMMIKEGAMKNPKPVHVFGQHVCPDIEVGKIGVRAGKYMASTDELHITVKGKGGHAAKPWKNIDPVLITAHIIVALQQIVSRNVPPEIPTVVSFGQIIANGRTNITPDEVYVAGTIRTFDEKWRKEIHQRIARMSEMIAESMGGSCIVTIKHGYPSLYNNPSLTVNVKDWAENYLGRENVVELPLRMTADDFAYFAEEVPSSFYRLGISNVERGIVSEQHSATFDVDENCLKTGMGLMAWIAVNALKNLD